MNRSAIIELMARGMVNPMTPEEWRQFIPHAKAALSALCDDAAFSDLIESILKEGYLSIQSADAATNDILTALQGECS